MQNNELANMIIESEYGSYLGLKETLSNHDLSIKIQKNFDIVESKNCKALFAKTSRIAGDDLDGVYGINLYRKCPSFEEAIVYWNKLPEAINDISYTGMFAFAAKNEADYQAKKKVYDDFYEAVFDNTNETKIVLVAPHCGDIRYKDNSVRINPKEGVDKWTAKITAQLFDLLKDSKPKSSCVVFVHTSSDYFKSYPAVIDLGDMGSSFPDTFPSFLKDLSDNFLPIISSKKKAYLERIFYQTRKAMVKKGSSDNTPLQFQFNQNSKRLKEYGIQDSVFKSSNTSAFYSHLQKDGQFILVNHQFSGRKIATLIPQNPGFDCCFQVECSEYYMETSSEIISSILYEILVCLSRSSPKQ